MFKKTALIAGIGLALSATAQADYRWELGAGYADGNVDTELKTDEGTRKNDNGVDIWDAYGTWYLETVDTSKGPLGEAAFLDHASSLSLNYSDGEADFNSIDNQDGERYGADFRYVAEGPGWKLSGVIADLGYQRLEVGDSEEFDIYNVGVGAYVTQNTTAVLNYKQVNINNGGDLDGYGLTLEHFFGFSSGGLKVSADGGKTVVKGEDDIDTWGLGGTWYLGNNWGISADYATKEWNNREADIWSAGVEWFITENFAVDLAYSEADPEDLDRPNGTLETTYDQVSLGALVRF